MGDGDTGRAAGMPQLYDTADVSAPRARHAARETLALGAVWGWGLHSALAMPLACLGLAFLCSPAWQPSVHGDHGLAAAAIM